MFVLGHRFALKKKKAIDMGPTGEARYFLSWVHEGFISARFTDTGIMLGFSCGICSLLCSSWVWVFNCCI